MINDEATAGARPELALLSCVLFLSVSTDNRCKPATCALLVVPGCWQLMCGGGADDPTEAVDADSLSNHMMQVAISCCMIPLLAVQLLPQPLLLQLLT
jgi:hypothetical protein